MVACAELPCTLLIPPWPSATSTIDYPIVTVTDGIWGTTITRRPITVTEWAFDPVTITRPPLGGPAPTTTTTTRTSSTKSSDAAIVAVIPVPSFASTSTWPPVTYLDKHGSPKMTRPTNKPHPEPPGPPREDDSERGGGGGDRGRGGGGGGGGGNLPDLPGGGPAPGRPNPTPRPTTHPPDKGHWPTKSVTIKSGPAASPTVRPCGFHAFQCPGQNPDPDEPGGRPEDPSEPDDEDGDDREDDDEPNWCVEHPSSSTPLSPPDPTTTTPTQPQPTPDPPPPPPLARPDPSRNKRSCYHGGAFTDNESMQQAYNWFCRNVPLKYGPLLSDIFIEGRFDVHSEYIIYIAASVEIYEGCEWEPSCDECVRYFKMPVDSCNCGSADHKQGGIVYNNCGNWRVDPIYERRYLDDDLDIIIR